MMTDGMFGDYVTQVENYREKIHRAIQEKNVPLDLEKKISSADGMLIGAEVWVHRSAYREVDETKPRAMEYIEGCRLEYELLERIILQISFDIIRYSRFKGNFSLGVSRWLVVQKGFADWMVETLERCGIARDRVVLRLGARLFTLDRSDEKIVQALSSLEAAGLHVCVADFGLGGATPFVLSRCRLHEVKIARHFFSQARTSRRASVFLRNMVRMIQSLNAKVIMDGVDKANDVQLAKFLGADMMQGSIFGTLELARQREFSEF